MITSQNGFSLMNVLVAVAIMGLVTYQISSFFDSSEKAQRKKDAKENVSMDLGLMISSIKKVSSMATTWNSSKPFTKLSSCKADLQNCIEMNVETSNNGNIKLEKYQFGTRCISPSSLISKLKRSTNDMVGQLRDFVKKRCKVTCGSNQLPIAVLHYGDRIQQSFPPSEPKRLTDSIGTAICAADEENGMIRLTVIGFSLDRTQKKAQLRGATRIVMLDAISKPSTMNIVDEK